MSKERPILFSGPMIRAILAGAKTQTRRIIKPQPPKDHPYPQDFKGEFHWNDTQDDHDDVSFWPAYDKPLVCPYGQPGDRLWVRETWLPWDSDHVIDGQKICYAADVSDEGNEVRLEGRPARTYKWRPSIFMPRWASRLTEIRCERLCSIDLSDAIAEGAMHVGEEIMQDTARFAAADKGGEVGPVDYFRTLWNRLNNGRGYGWNVDPWLWVLSFKVVEGK